jgi:hypothetical protein
VDSERARRVRVLGEVTRAAVQDEDDSAPAGDDVRTTTRRPGAERSIVKERASHRGPPDLDAGSATPMMNLDRPIGLVWESEVRRRS